jgi:hypothetical protein
MQTSFDGTDPANRRAYESPSTVDTSRWPATPGSAWAQRSGESQPVSFYLPDGGVAQVPTAMAVELNVRRFRSVGSVGRLDLGAFDEQVSVAPDPRGGGQWLFVSFRTPVHSHETAGAQLPVTVQTAG